MPSYLYLYTRVPVGINSKAKLLVIICEDKVVFDLGVQLKYTTTRSEELTSRITDMAESY